jgi:hypothetical protein
MYGRTDLAARLFIVRLGLYFILALSVAAASQRAAQQPNAGDAKSGAFFGYTP